MALALWSPDGRHCLGLVPPAHSIQHGPEVREVRDEVAKVRCPGSRSTATEMRWRQDTEQTPSGSRRRRLWGPQ